MKLRIILLAAFTITLAASLPAESYSSRESFSRTGAFTSIGKLTLENVNGNVEIKTWDRKEILIEGEKSAKTDEELKLIEMTIDLNESAAAVKVRLPKRSGFFSNNIRASVSFKITIPATATLERINVVNATIDIQGIRGSVRAESVNGSIHARELGGNVHLETVNGRIDTSVATVASGQKFFFETVNGQIDATFPSDTGAELHASVVNGSIDCDFPIGAQGRISGRKVSGKIGDGRAEIEAKSVNGTIHIKKR